MTLSQLGNAAGAAASDLVEVPRQRETVAPQRNDLDHPLLDSVRRSLAPGDPVARLLAGWPVPPARAIEVRSTRRGPGWLPLPG